VARLVEGERGTAGADAEGVGGVHGGAV
jgi:hypothetical protein